jgi:hypothetical protein
MGWLAAVAVRIALAVGGGELKDPWPPSVSDLKDPFPAVELAPSAVCNGLKDPFSEGTPCLEELKAP